MKAFRHLDQILRGDATRFTQLREKGIDFPVSPLVLVLVLLAMIYGACMGVFSLTSTGSRQQMQIVASTVKLPLLFLATSLVTMPSLYVFNALVGSRLSFAAFLRLLVGSMAVTIAVLSSLGPIVAFFSVSTTSYSFMVIMNVVIFSLSGLLGLSFLLQTLNRLTVLENQRRLDAEVARIAAARAAAPVVPPEPGEEQITPEVQLQMDIARATRAGALDRLEGQTLGPHVKTVFRVWVIVFGLVGLQMGWVLRPFIGSPRVPFEWFRARGGSVFESVLWHLKHLLGG